MSEVLRVLFDRATALWESKPRPGVYVGMYNVNAAHLRALNSGVLQGHCPPCILSELVGHWLRDHCLLPVRRGEVSSAARRAVPSSHPPRQQRSEGGSCGIGKQYRTHVPVPQESTHKVFVSCFWPATLALTSLSRVLTRNDASGVSYDLSRARLFQMAGLKARCGMRVMPPDLSVIHPSCRVCVN